MNTGAGRFGAGSSATGPELGIGGPPDPEAAASYALHRIIGKVTDETHAATLALVDELIAVGRRMDPVPAVGDAITPLAEEPTVPRY